jgi:VWFA-related protein
MRQRIRSVHFLIWAAVFLISPMMSAQQEPTYTIRVNSNLVQISIVARDRNGRLVRDLTGDDFAVIEDGRPQQLSAVDLESVTVPQTTGMSLLPLQLPVLTSTTSVPASAVRGLRLVLLFFDFASLDPDDAARSLRAAEAYVRTIGPADRVAIASLAAKLEVQQDFTGDSTALRHALQRLHGLSRTVLEGKGGNRSDDSVYEVFSTYRRLRSLRVLTSALAQVSQKKSVVIFAGNPGSDPDLVGITATVDAAVRAGVSFYGIDATGLSATPPLGDATRPSSYGTTVLSGTAIAQGSGDIHDQDLLYALARGTGGRAFFDSNDFERPFRTMEDDTREYYMLSYRSSNSRRDGRYRRISVRARRRGLELKHPAGYYGPRDRTRVSTRDTERVLAEELAADLPATGLPVFGFVSHLRMANDLFYVPITVFLPAEALLKDGIASSAAIGLAVVDGRGHLVRKLRDLIPTSVVTQHPTRTVQYETATELPAGEYNVRLVVVQNGTGEVGSFSTLVRLPRRDQSRISVSSLFSGTQAAASSNSPKSPLVLNGSRLILNPLAEYGDKRPFAMQYQVECGAVTHGGEAGCDARQIRSSLQCFSSDQRVFSAEPPVSTVTADTAVFRVEFPAGSLHPGTYKCHVTAINPQCNAFAFGAAQLRIRDELEPNLSGRWF